VQGIERYKNGLIAYSLGNFQFPAKNVDRLRRTIILSVDISASGVNEFEIVPVLIDDNYLPHPLTGQAKQEMLDHIERISKVIHEPIFTNESWFDAIAYEHLSDNLQSWKIRINKYGLKHLAQCIRWHMSPFVIRCYWSVIKARLHPK
jgi:poly-gamma-glutamate synthesis protein (capsule biosynthesis protein)